jgi:hypothetical protein
MKKATCHFELVFWSCDILTLDDLVEVFLPEYELLDSACGKGACFQLVDLGVLVTWIGTKLEGRRVGSFGIFVPKRTLEQDWRRNRVETIGVPILWFLASRVESDHFVVFINLLGSGVLTQCPMPEVV